MDTFHLPINRKVIVIITFVDPITGHELPYEQPWGVSLDPSKVIVINEPDGSLTIKPVSNNVGDSAIVQVRVDGKIGSEEQFFETSVNIVLTDPADIVGEVKLTF